ncbi:hypothetical protein [Actinomadura alba]|uniref:Uncharacterized protein n=1 Tax=Actinomadura alba TaxID=406431 RepID=A0ABR7LPK5_9ACTN|nr:hypothetical protein [Actinomadura alba]MBC6466691.1 hypothetical protein [Actinomadura alba]
MSISTDEIRSTLARYLGRHPDEADQIRRTVSNSPESARNALPDVGRSSL